MTNSIRPASGTRSRRLGGLALAGLVAAAVVVGVSSAGPETEPVSQESSVAGAEPTASRQPAAKSAVRAPQVAAVVPAPVAPAAVLPAAPTLAMTCPVGGTAPSPTFGHQVVAAAPYRVVIDYGDGDVYGNDQDHLAAVFAHTYALPGAFLVTAAVTDAAGQVASASCTYTWAAPTPRPVPAPQPAPAPRAPAPQPQPQPQPQPDASYQNCDAVRAAGAAPIRAGDPGWQPKFDRDGDGVGCE